MTWLTGDGKGCSHLDQTWVQFTGRTLKEQLEWGWLDSVHPDDAENCLRTYEGAFEARKPFVMEYRLRRYDGEHRWVQSIGQPRYRDHGKFVGYSGVVVDIHDREEMLQRLQSMQAELAHCQRIVALGEMAGVLAHEINQPLGAIAAFAQAAVVRLRSSQFDSAELTDVLDTIAERALAAGQITRRIKSFVSRTPPKASLLDINRLAQDVVAVLRNDAEIRFTRIEVAFSQPEAHILGDAVQVQQVLVNLIRNGIDAMAHIPRSERVLRVETRVLSDTISVQVSDRGPGIPEPLLSQIFEPYFTTKLDGLGIGLSISRTIIASHGGQIAARRNPNGGMTFEISLPRAESAVKFAA